MVDLAMELATSNGGGLFADHGCVSKAACSMFAKYYYVRPDVTKAHMTDQQIVAFNVLHDEIELLQVYSKEPDLVKKLSTRLDDQATW